MPWIHYAVLLRFYRDNNWKGFLVSIPVLTAATVIAQYAVFPMDVYSLAVFMLVANVVGLIPFIIDRLLYRKVPSWAMTLVFPVITTLFTFIVDQGPQGTWSNTAYSQYHFTALIQMASITGIYGINFLMFWAASSANQIVELKRQGKKMHKSSFAMPIFMAIFLVYGFIQLNTESELKSEVVAAGITIDDSSLTEEMYYKSTGKELKIPKNISQSDPILQELNKGMIDFMANTEDPKFKSVYEKMDEILGAYLKASKEAIKNGAKIVSWSEAAIVNIKEREEEYEQIVSAFADEMNAYIFFPTAVFHPEKVGKEDVFIENKVLTFDPEGRLLNTYFKNIPIMGVEPSFPGDGVIPVIETEYGNFSPIICYDADHPQLVGQISNSKTDILMVPTGDWKAISPYHTYMAAFRCIENGVSMLKTTSNGLGAMIDDKGRIIESYDYFDNETIKVMMNNMPVRSSTTLYALSFPFFIGGIQITFLLILVWVLFKYLHHRVSIKSKNMNIA